MIRSFALTAALSLLIALPAGAEIYSWRDKDGTVHYSDQAPPTGDVKVLRGGITRPAARNGAGETEEGEQGQPQAQAQPQGQTQAKPAAADNKPKTAAEQEQAFRQRRAEAAEAQAKADKDSANEAERARRCQAARNQLAALQSGQRMARFGEDGERVVLEDADRAAETERTQRLIDEVCR